MPLFQYFGWVGSFLFAALIAANWCCPAPVTDLQRSDLPLNQQINIRIHTDHKWPERIVFDTTRSGLTPDAAGEADAGVALAETPAGTRRPYFDTFAELRRQPAGTCFRPPCLARQAPSAEPSSIARLAAHRNLSGPNRFHRPPGRS